MSWRGDQPHDEPTAGMASALRVSSNPRAFRSSSASRATGTLADLLSPARLVIFGTLLTTLNKPMFAASGYVFATFGTVSTLYWITAAKACVPWTRDSPDPTASPDNRARCPARCMLYHARAVPVCLCDSLNGLPWNNAPDVLHHGRGLESTA